MKFSEKSKIINIVQKDKLTDEDKEVLTSLLSKLSNEDLIIFYDEGKGVKECSHCHQVLPYSAFHRRSGKRGKAEGSRKFLAVCKKCNIAVRAIRRYKKKFKLIQEKFNGKCSKCSLSLIWLSMIHFHHPDPLYKTAEWKNIKDKSYSNILEWAKRDKVIPLCNNCHKKEEASIFHKFKDLILRSDLFSMSPEQIDQLLIVGKSMNSNEKTKIQKWLRKRYIIEKVFGGKCIGCGKVNIFNNLPALTLHHRNTLIKSVEMTEIFRFNCETIFKIILRENAVCLCANCHSLLHSDIHLHFKELFNDDYFKNNFSELFLGHFEKENVKKYNKILENINKFKFKDIDIKSPLKLEFDIKNIWKIHFLEALYFMRENQISNFRIKDFIKSFKYSRQYAYEFMNKLAEKGYLNKIKEEYYVHVRFEITDIGLEKINELIEKHAEMAKKIQSQVDIMSQSVSNTKERTLSYEDVIKKYPFQIFELILQNGYNEFTNIQLSKRVKRLARTINENFKEKIIPEGIVEKVEMPLYIQTFQYNNVFRLTKKGYQLIKKYFENKPSLEELNKLQPEIIKNNLIRYSVFIYNLTQQKGFNEFIKKEIYELALTKRKDKGRYTGYLIRNSLISKGIIEELKEPQHISKEIPATKIYKLTDKAIEIAKNIINKQ